MINFENEFSNQIWDDNNSSYYDQYITPCIPPFLRLPSDDSEIYQIPVQRNIQIEEPNDDLINVQPLNQPSNPTNEKNNSSQINTHVIQCMNDKQEQIKNPLVINRKKQILKLKQYWASPGESKNLPKCYARQLKLFIRNVCDQTKNPSLKNLLNDQDIQKFLKVKVENLSKFELIQFIKSPKGSIFSKEFFGKCMWNFGVVKESKTNVQVLYRHNFEAFYQIIKNTKKQE